MNTTETAVVNFSLITFVGVIILFFFPGTPSPDGYNGPATSAVWAYGTMVCGLIGLTALLYRNTSLSSLAEAPAASLLVVVVTLCVLNLYYFKPINAGKMPPQFVTFNSISGYLVFVQTCILIHIVLVKNKIIPGNVNSTASLGGLFLLNTLSIIVAILMGLIMEFYKTDG